MKTLHPSVKLLIIGLYIGVISQGLNPIIFIALYYLPFIIVPFAPQVAGVCAVVIAYFLEEAIRRSKYPRKIRIMAALGTALLAAAIYALFLAWLHRRLGF
jgi:ABC-type uncharacterized transport system permease subunit